MSQKLTLAFASTRFFQCVLWLNDTSYDPTAKVSEGTNRNLPARNMLIQLLGPCESQCTDGRTDGRHDDANSRSYCVAVRSVKNETETPMTTLRG